MELGPVVVPVGELEFDHHHKHKHDYDHHLHDHNIDSSSDRGLDQSRMLPGSGSSDAERSVHLQLVDDSSDLPGVLQRILLCGHGEQPGMLLREQPYRQLHVTVLELSERLFGRCDAGVWRMELGAVVVQTVIIHYNDDDNYHRHDDDNVDSNSNRRMDESRLLPGRPGANAERHFKVHDVHDPCVMSNVLHDGGVRLRRY